MIGCQHVPRIEAWRRGIRVSFSGDKSKKRTYNVDKNLFFGDNTDQLGTDWCTGLRFGLGLSQDSFCIQRSDCLHRVIQYQILSRVTGIMGVNIIWRK